MIAIYVAPLKTRFQGALTVKVWQRIKEKTRNV